MNIETGLGFSTGFLIDKDERESELESATNMGGGRERGKDELAKRRRWTFGGWAMSTILRVRHSSGGGGDGRQRISAIIRPRCVALGRKKFVTVPRCQCEAALHLFPTFKCLDSFVYIFSSTTRRVFSISRRYGSSPFGSSVRRDSHIDAFAQLSSVTIRVAPQ